VHGAGAGAGAGPSPSAESGVTPPGPKPRPRPNSTYVHCPTPILCQLWRSVHGGPTHQLQLYSLVITPEFVRDVVHTLTRVWGLVTRVAAGMVHGDGPLARTTPRPWTHAEVTTALWDITHGPDPHTGLSFKNRAERVAATCLLGVHPDIWGGHTYDSIPVDIMVHSLRSAPRKVSVADLSLRSPVRPFAPLE